MGALLAACGLSVVGVAQNEGDAGPAPSGEASAADMTRPNVDGAVDATKGDAVAEEDAIADGGIGADADADVGSVPCTVLIDDHFATLSASWKLVGDSPKLEAPGKLVMTHTPVQTAALWWTPQLEYAGTLRIAMSYASSGPENGEGMTIAWQQNADFRAGGASNGSGLCGANMFGVAVAARFSNQLDVLSSFQGNCGFTAEITSAVPAMGTFGFTGTPETLRATLVSGGTTITTTSNVAVPAKGYVGFTASTAAGSTRQTILSAVRVESCP